MIKRFATFDWYRVIRDYRCIQRVDMSHFLRDKGGIKVNLIFLVPFMLKETIVLSHNRKLIISDSDWEEGLTVLMMDGWMAMVHRVDKIHPNRISRF